MEARGKDCSELHALLFAFVNDSVAATKRDLQWLFHDNVLAGAGGGDSRFHVGSAGGRDRHDVYSRIDQHLLHVVVRCAANLVGKLLGSIGRHIAARNEFGTAHVLDCSGVKID